jgi:hypothetical protein
MTAHADWTDRFSAYLDGELDAAGREAVEAHVAGCSDCRAVLDELRAIAAAAPGYGGAPPARDLWPGIRDEIERRRVVRFPARTARPARRYSLPQLVAASLAVALLTGGGTWLLLRATLGAPAAPAVSLQPVVRLTADQAFDQAVADLERILAEGRSRLDTATVRVIEENLALIDRAIAEARAAVAADSANVDLQSWVAANQRRKLDLLRRAASALRATES